ncbi:MAG: hypothetical protein ABJH04_07595 [Cyclobacteriaceae bacterium]
MSNALTLIFTLLAFTLAAQGPNYRKARSIPKSVEFTSNLLFGMTEFGYDTRRKVFTKTAKPEPFTAVVSIDFTKRIISIINQETGKAQQISFRLRTRNANNLTWFQIKNKEYPSEFSVDGSHLIVRYTELGTYKVYMHTPEETYKRVISFWYPNS